MLGLFAETAARPEQKFSVYAGIVVLLGLATKVHSVDTTAGAAASLLTMLLESAGGIAVMI